jgi:hypothetical protein
MHAARLSFLGIVIWATAFAGVRARADEIRLKDGQILYGVIVAYEDNMFKVKTNFGFVLVEKDKIASIIPTAPGVRQPAKAESTVKKPASPRPEAVKPPAEVTHKQNPPAATSTPASAAAKPSSMPSVSKPGTVDNGRTGSTTATPDRAPAETPNVSTVTPRANPLPEKKPASGTASAPKTPSVPPSKNSNAHSGAEPSPIASTATPPTPAKTPSTSSVPVVTPIETAKPKEIEPPANRESLQGNVYTNYSHGFHMYKPPSWRLIDDARKALPNAIVAMGTVNESTLMIVGEEKTKNSLDVTAVDVEKRLRDTYGNYRRISQRKTVAGGFPAIEIHYRGLADDHDWSGTLLVVARGGDMFSVLGMTYADTDLIQIQENVIARAIASLEFNSN